MSLSKNATDGKELIVETQKFFACRSKIKRMWNETSTGILELIHSFDTINLSDGTYNPVMRQTSLKGDVAQSLDELYETATLANPLFLQCLRDMLADVDIPLDRLDVYTLKKRPRAAEKAADDYSDREPGPAVSWLSDIVRSSIVCETESEVLRVVKFLLDLEAKEARGEVDVTKPRLRLVRLKNRFVKPTPGGFRDFNTNVVLVIPGVVADGKEERPELRHVCELQVHLRALKEFGNTIGSHAVYEFFRTYFKGNMAAVEERMRILEAMFGSEKDDDDFPRDAPLSLSALVDAVVAEGDKVRLSAAYDLFYMMAAYGAAARIQKAQIASLDPTIDVEECICLEANLANSMALQGEVEEAKNLYLSVIAKKTARKGADHEDTLHTESNLASLLYAKKEYAEAKKLYAKVLPRQTELLGAEHADTLRTEGNLAGLLRQLGEFDEAKKLYIRVLARKTKLFGPEHESTINQEGNYANLLSQLGEHEEARKLFTSVLAKKTRLRGMDHIDTLDTAGNLASVLFAQGELEEAKIIYKSVLAKKTKLMGAEHADLLSTEQNLANLLYKQGEWEEAKMMYRSVITKTTKLMGAEHDDTISAEGKLANLMEKRGELEEAKIIYKSVLAKKTTILGADHLSTLGTEMTLANLLSQLREYDAAKQLYTCLLEKQSRLLGPEHKDTLDTESILAAVLTALEEYYEAKTMWTILLEKQTRLKGAEHTSTVYAEGGLAKVLADLGELDKAKLLYSSVLAKKTKLMGADHASTLHTELTLANLLAEQGEYDEAKKLCTGVLAKQTKLLGAENADTLLTECYLADLLMKEGHLEEAKVMLHRVLETQTALLGQEHPHTRLTAMNLEEVTRMIDSYVDPETVLTTAERLLEYISNDDDVADDAGRFNRDFWVCDEEHKLDVLTAPDEERGEVFCDRCGRGDISMEKLYMTCKECSYDLCCICASKQIDEKTPRDFG